MSDYKVVLDQDTVLNVSINLSKIPPEFLRTTDKGDTYLAINVTARKDGADQYGNDLNVFLNKNKEQKEADQKNGVKTRYCGNGKSVKFERNGGTPMQSNPWANPNAGQPQQGQQQPPTQGGGWFAGGQPIPAPTQGQQQPPVQQQEGQQQQWGNQPNAGFDPSKKGDLPF